MQREHLEIGAPDLDRPGTLIRYGHFGRPVLAFPCERGRAGDYEANGMVDAVADLIESGRVTLYCIDSYDHLSWSDRTLCLDERSRRHAHYESWVTQTVVPVISADSPGAENPVVTGCSLGAFHALNIMLRRTDLFPVAICQSGSYDLSQWRAWGERGEATYANNPAEYLRHIEGDHLRSLHRRAFAVLTVGRGEWDAQSTDPLASARHIAGLMEANQIPHELDEWGTEAAHDWPWWRHQLARHLPRFC